MKIVFTCIYALFFITNVFAQKEVDSLKSIWTNTKLQDTTRLKSLNLLIAYTENDGALVLSNEMLDFARKTENIKYQVEALTLIGDIYFEEGNREKGEKNFREGLELAKTIEDSILYSKKLDALADIYYNDDDYTNAFKTYEKSVIVSKKIGDSVTEGWSVDRIGLIYRALGEFEKSEKYHLEHLRLSTKYGIKHSISGANGNLGGLYFEMGQVQKSLKHWIEGIKLAKELELPEYASIGTYNLINIYIKEKQYIEAIKYLDEYREVTKQFPASKYKRHIATFQSRIDFGLKNYHKSLNEAYHSLSLYNDQNLKPSVELLKILYEVNKKLNNHKKALEYFEQYQIAIDDENEDKARAEIQNIVFNNQLVTDSVAQAQEKELLNASFQEGLRKKNREKNLFLTLGLFVLILAISYFVFSRKIANSERKRLKEVNQLKNALFTNITHEFRTPLTVIKGMTDSIKSDLLKNRHDDLDTSLGMIERNSDSLLHLVNEMLDLSKIESGNMELQMVQSDVIPFLKYLCESFSSFAQENKINLTVYSEIDTLEMDFDGNKLTSVISNLISNAIKFTPKYGKIIVHINQLIDNNKPYLFIKIKDNGIGISEEELPNVFNRFYQTDTSIIRKQEGTGIGLALTKELIGLMNGSMHVKSALGKGSEFSLRIPITKKASKITSVEIEKKPTIPIVDSASNQSKPYFKTNSELPLVLIIEDNMDVAHYLKTCLTNNYDTIHAVNGNEGIQIAFERIPDIIICDVMMPEKDGFEVCETLKSDERTDHIPIIILTAKVTTEDRLTGLSHGADAYLSKPFNKTELFTRLDQLVAIRKKLIRKVQKKGAHVLLQKQTKNPKLQFLQKAITIVHDNIGDSKFGSDSLAKELLISESQLYRKIKALTEKSTAIFIRSIRLHYAKEILVSSDKTVSEVAYDVGFNDPSWFSRAFKVEFGFSPSESLK